LKGYQYSTPARSVFLRAFNYHRVETLPEAVSLLEGYGEEAQVLAGGTSLIPLLRARKVHPQHVVNIMTTPNLDYITYNGRSLRVGTLTSLRSLEKHTAIQQKLQAVYEALHATATVQVRNMGTVGGDIAAAKYGSLYGSVDLPTVLSTLGTSVRVLAPDGEKVLPVEKLVLEPGSIVGEVQIPMPTKGTGTAYLRVGRLSEDRAPKLSIAVMLTTSNGFCEDVKIAGTAPTPYRAAKAEEFLKGKKLTDENLGEAAEKVAEEVRPVTDIRSTAEYRREVAKVLAGRGIRIALERAKTLKHDG